MMIAKLEDLKITVYEKKGCPGCVATQRLLEKADVPFEVKNLEDQEVFKEVSTLGHKQAPIVTLTATIDEEETVVLSWSGFRLESIERATAVVKAGGIRDRADMKQCSSVALARLLIECWKQEDAEKLSNGSQT